MAEKEPTSARKPSKIVSLEKLDENSLRILHEKYPEGYRDYVVKYPKPDGTVFFAIPLSTPDANLLVKVNVKIDVFSDEDDDKDFGSEIPDENIAEEDMKGEGVGVEHEEESFEEPYSNPEEEEEAEED